MQKCTVKHVPLLVLILSLLVCNRLQANPQDTASAQGQTISAGEILQKVYNLSQGSIPAERAFVLVRLANLSLQIDRTLASQYAKELFEESFGIPVGWYNYRHAFQMNAVAVLASAGRVDEAMELFERMEPPEQIADDPSQDLREQALLALTLKFIQLEDEKGMAWARDAVRRLAATPPYPYLAAQRLISYFLEKDPFEAEAIYAEAVAAFERDKEFFYGREYFVPFLLAFAGKFGPGLERQGVRSAVEAILETSAPENQRTMSRLTLQDGTTITLESRADRLLFELLPLLAQYEPRRTEEILETRTHLQRALNEGSSIQQEQSVVVIGKHEDVPERLSAVAARRLAWQRAQQVGNLAAEDPDKALSLARGIEHIAPRAGALARSAAALAQEQPRKAVELLDESRSLLEKIDDPPQRLRVLSAILRGHVALQDVEKANETYAEILELGEELAEQEIASAPQVPLFVTTSYQRLSEATRSAAKMDPEARILQLSMLESPLLRWLLTLDIAEAMLRSQGPSN